MEQWSPVLIEWADAHGGDQGWVDHSEIDHKPAGVVTVGLLLKQDSVGITVVMSKQDEAIGGYMFIPACNVVSITQLNKGDRDEQDAGSRPK